MDAKTRIGHLVIKRKFGQGIKIGDEIEIVVEQTRGTRGGRQVSLSIFAPTELRIDRLEGYLAENKGAVTR